MVEDATLIARSPDYSRLDGPDALTGAAKYAADIVRPGMLWAQVLRSPVPHARIVSIDVSRAKALRGVHAVLIGQDVGDYRVGRSMRDMPVLARDKVRFIGEKVAAVAAEDRETAEEALGLIEVEYDELPAVFDPIEAMRDGAPLIHEPATVRAWATPSQKVADYPNSVSNPVWGASAAEMEEAFAQCAHVFEHTFRTPVQHQGYIEPHACLVEVVSRSGLHASSSGDDSQLGTRNSQLVHIWASNKAPFLLLDYLRQGIGLERDEVEIHLLPLGGDFGGKGSFMDIPLVYFLAQASGRPVKLVMSYGEELMAGNPRHAAVIRVKSGFDAQGKLQARWTTSVYNSGGYAAFKPAPDATLPRVRYGGLGAYPEIPTWRVEGHMVYTNTVPCGHMRAPGGAQPAHAIECHMDLCARAMGIDPLDLKIMNAPRRQRKTDRGEPGTIPQSREVLRAAADAIGWSRSSESRVPSSESLSSWNSQLGTRNPLLGRGIALVDVINSPADAYTARMIVQRDGRVVVHTPIIEQGSGMLTTFRLLAAEEFGLPPDEVHVEQTMEGIEYDRGVGGSRITRIIGKMIGMMGESLRTRLADLLAAEFGYEAQAITFGPDGFQTPDGRIHSVAEVASLAESDLWELLRYDVRPEDTVETYAAVAVEVEVDRETGRVTPRRVVTAHEVGRIVNPVMHQGQIDGGLIQGMGYALAEGLSFDEGRVTTVNLHEYKMPNIADLPRLETLILAPDLSLGLTPIGEGPNVGMSAAITCAVMDAVGGQVEIPVSPEALLS
jgi:CO/xanthine dehydrogenase Mo-binding subunit